ITQSQISYNEYKARYDIQLKEIKSLQAIIKILESKLASAQKDAFSIQENLTKTETENLSLKSKIDDFKQIEVELERVRSELDHLKSEAISKSVDSLTCSTIVGGDDEKNISKFDLQIGMRFCGGHKFKKSDTITLELEPSNTYDKNAIKVMVDGIHKAYVTKNENVSIGDLMKKYSNYQITAHGKKNYNQSASLNLEYSWMVCEKCRNTLQASRDYDYTY
ncbi:10554_t:CDS:2, partial [Ambispora gerdemannii]